MKSKTMILIFCLLFISSLAFAETIHLKSGKTIEGEIIERTDEYIKVDIGVGVPITYFLEDIVDTRKEISTSVPEYIDDKFGIKITGPTGWHMIYGKELLGLDDGVEETEDEQAMKWYINSGKGFIVTFSKDKYKPDQEKWFYNPGITLMGLISPPFTSLQSTEEYAKSSIDAINKDPKIKILEQPKKQDINGKDWICYKSLEEESQKLLVCYYVDLESQVEYMFAATAAEEIFDENKDSFNASLQSIVIGD